MSITMRCSNSCPITKPDTTHWCHSHFIPSPSSTREQSSTSHSTSENQHHTNIRSIFLIYSTSQWKSNRTTEVISRSICFCYILCLYSFKRVKFLQAYAPVPYITECELQLSLLLVFAMLEWAAGIWLQGLLCVRCCTHCEDNAPLVCELVGAKALAALRSHR